MANSNDVLIDIINKNFNIDYEIDINYITTCNRVVYKKRKVFNLKYLTVSLFIMLMILVIPFSIALINASLRKSGTSHSFIDKYTNLIVQDNYYTSAKNVISEAYLEEYLGEGQAYFYNSKENKNDYLNCLIYSISNLDKDVAVGAKFEETEEVYFYYNNNKEINDYYDFLNMYSIKDYIEINEIYSGDYLIDAISKDEIIDFLYLLPNCKNQGAYEITEDSIVINVNLQLFNFNRQCIYITSDYYLLSNIGYRSVSFYIGEEYYTKLIKIINGK